MSKQESISQLTSTTRRNKLSNRKRIVNRKMRRISRRVNLRNLITVRQKLLEDMKRSGNSSKIFGNLNEITDLSTKFLAENVFEITPKTLSNYKNKDIKLPSVIIELANKLKILYESGVEIFGSKNRFNEWLKVNNVAMDNVSPAEYLKTSTGIDLIYEELKKIEFGATA